MPPKQSTSGPASRGRGGRPAANPTKSAARAGSASKSTGSAAAGRDSTSATSRGRGRGRGNAAASRGRTQQRGAGGDEDEDRDGQRVVVDLDGDTEDMEVEEEGEDGDEEEEEERQKIPSELLTRILHGFFEQEGSRVTRDANSAVARYVDVFVREAIARAAVEREGGFLEVEDLEKIAPQLLMDL